MRMERNRFRIALSAGALVASLIIFGLRDLIQSDAVIDSLKSFHLDIHAYEHPSLHKYPNYSYFSEYRGRGWLYTRHDMVLHGYVVNNQQLLVQSTTPCDPALVTIWARVTGPVTMAGKMTPGIVPNCEWVFDFDVQVVGSYKVEAKLVLWNGNAPFHLNRCRTRHINPKAKAPSVKKEKELETLNDEVLLRKITGFKFYDEEASCCEVCARDLKCTRWESDEKDKCRVYGKKSKDKGRTLMAAGEQRMEFTSYYMGCGWSFYLLPDRPCNVTSADDTVSIENPRFNITTNPTSNAKKKRPASGSIPISLSQFWTDHQKLPYCKNLKDMANGRWVDLPQQVQKQCGKPKYDVPVRIAVSRYHPDKPGVCWMGDILPALTRRCMEPSCKEIRKTTEWHGSEMLRTRSQYHGFWAPRACKLRYFSGKDVQQCVKAKNLKGVKVDGASIAGFLRIYFNHRNTNITWMNGTDAQLIRLSTLKLPHLLWHNSDAEIIQTLKKTTSKGFSTSYLVSSMFISSEREAHVNVERGLRVNELAQKYLNGFRLVDWVNSSAAFAYETATQTDGLHIIGPPMKLVWNMFWNDLCAGMTYSPTGLE